MLTPSLANLILAGGAGIGRRWLFSLALSELAKMRILDGLKEVVENDEEESDEQENTNDLEKGEKEAKQN